MKHAHLSVQNAGKNFAVESVAMNSYTTATYVQMLGHSISIPLEMMDLLEGGLHLIGAEQNLERRKRKRSKNDQEVGRGKRRENQRVEIKRLKKKRANTSKPHFNNETDGSAVNAFSKCSLEYRALRIG